MQRLVRQRFLLLLLLLLVVIICETGVHEDSMVTGNIRLTLTVQRRIGVVMHVNRRGHLAVLSPERQKKYLIIKLNLEDNCVLFCMY